MAFLVTGILWVAAVIALIGVAAFTAAVMDYHNFKRFSCETPKNPPPPPPPSAVARASQKQCCCKCRCQSDSAKSAQGEE